MSQGNQHMTFSVFIRHEVEKEGVGSQSEGLFTDSRQNVKIAFGSYGLEPETQRHQTIVFLISLRSA